jgi:hypothetical protein
MDLSDEQDTFPCSTAVCPVLWYVRDSLFYSKYDTVQPIAEPPSSS